ncbi:MAG TPA: helix-turn-helix domain-containing protein [Acidothermaceae bacterium]|jgi:AraC-like DNA-binding protein
MNTELGPDVELVRHRPAGLGGLVAGVVGLRERSTAVIERRQPAGSLTMVRLSLGDRLAVTDLAVGEGAGRSYESFVAGFMPGHSGTRYSGGQDCIQLYLTPRGVRRLLGVPSSELAERLVDLTDVASLLGGTLTDQLTDKADWSARFACLDTLLWRLAAAGKDADLATDHLWRRIWTTSGRVSVADLVEESGWSHRRLIARLRAHVGVSPKAAAAVVRFEHALHALGSADGTPGLADIAALHGYADQSHLTRDFARYAGASPAAIRRGTVATAWTALGRGPAAKGASCTARLIPVSSS